MLIQNTQAMRLGCFFALDIPWVSRYNKKDITPFEEGMNTKDLFLKTNPRRLFFMAALPGAISMLASALYGIFDGIFVGQFLGDTAFAAVNLAFPFVILIYALSDLIAVGSAVPISICLGKRQDKEANELFTCSVLLILFTGALMGTLLYTTAPALLKLLGAKSSIIVVTNSTKAPFISPKVGVKAFVSGGEVSKVSFAYVGTQAERFIRSFNADICFFSVSALTPDGRLTDNSVAENQISKTMIECSKKSVLLLNSQKIGEPQLNTLCRVNDIDYIVSEKDISDLFPAHKEKFI